MLFSHQVSDMRTRILHLTEVPLNTKTKCPMCWVTMELSTKILNSCYPYIVCGKVKKYFIKLCFLFSSQVSATRTRVSPLREDPRNVEPVPHMWREPWNWRPRPSHEKRLYRRMALLTTGRWRLMFAFGGVKVKKVKVFILKSEYILSHWWPSG